MNRNWRLTTSCGWVVALVLSGLILAALWLLYSVAAELVTR